MGEVTEDSVILQARLTKTAKLIDGDLPGADGVGYFERGPYSPVLGLEATEKTKWLKAIPENDYILKAKFSGLQAGYVYSFRLVYGPDKKNLKNSPEIGPFRTLHGKRSSCPISFAVVTGMNYHKFQTSKKVSQEEKQLGFPGLAALNNGHPDFFIAIGDNVYYDHPKEESAKTREQMRKKCHEQFSKPRFHELFSHVPTYWLNDDHDHRYDDCDNTGNEKPLPELGISVFREQLPVVGPQDKDAVTYRTLRINKDLQIWLVEGSDYRSPNNMPDGPGKTIWGETQKQWLKDTLLESDATFKLLISPTPIIGPGDAYKKDNHTNIGGFQHERDEFFAWLKENEFDKKNFYIICGDRHWQYHSVHPSGFEEFSCGAFVDANARIGRLPGDPKSTDPNAQIKQPYCMQKASGGYLLVSFMPPDNGKQASLGFDLCSVRHDHPDRLFYHVEKRAR